MSLFKHYRHFYKEPERFTPAEARARKLTLMLEREKRFAQVPNFQSKLSALSQANKKVLVNTRRVVNDHKAYGHKAALIAAALAQFKDTDFADPAKRAQYRDLRKKQELLRFAGKSRGGQQKVTPTGGDKRRYDPTGKAYASLTSGNIAKLSLRGWSQVFRFPSVTIPCVQRHVRREVMFAKGKAGRGYRVKHRRNWSSDIPC
nr:MAG: hypothetical protein [Microvirus sp.]